MLSAMLGLSSYAQQRATAQNPTENFYTVRNQILKELNEAKRKGDINETEREDDDAMAKLKRWEHFMLPRVGPKGIFFDADSV